MMKKKKEEPKKEAKKHEAAAGRKYNRSPEHKEREKMGMKKEEHKKPEMKKPEMKKEARPSGEPKGMGVKPENRHAKKPEGDKGMKEGGKVEMGKASPMPKMAKPGETKVEPVGKRDEMGKKAAMPPYDDAEGKKGVQEHHVVGGKGEQHPMFNHPDSKHSFVHHIHVHKKAGT